MAEMPEVVGRLSDFVYGWRIGDDRTTWKRVRFAVTIAELDALREWIRSDGTNRLEFAWAIKGVPLVIEDDPEHPNILLEHLR